MVLRNLQMEPKRRAKEWRVWLGGASSIIEGKHKVRYIAMIDDDPRSTQNLVEDRVGFLPCLIQSTVCA
ncbi:MAG: hypothetical protein IPO81_00185 [Kouleothrix sp.]|nr:hypothetical protein [Kouleothrix sp.]